MFKKGNIPYMKGRHHSVTTRQKMSKALRGITPWNKGRYTPKQIRYERHKKYERAIENKLFDMIGGRVCGCFGVNCWHEGRCLATDHRCIQFDHVNGGGRQQFRKLGRYKMIRYYLNDPPKAKRELQSLCANCNWVKRFNNKEN